MVAEFRDRVDLWPAPYVPQTPLPLLGVSDLFEVEEMRVLWRVSHLSIRVHGSLDILSVETVLKQFFAEHEAFSHVSVSQGSDGIKLSRANFISPRVLPDHGKTMYLLTLLSDQMKVSQVQSLYCKLVSPQSEHELHGNIFRLFVWPEVRPYVDSFLGTKPNMVQSFLAENNGVLTLVLNRLEGQEEVQQFYLRFWDHLRRLAAGNG